MGINVAFNISPGQRDLRVGLADIMKRYFSALFIAAVLLCVSSPAIAAPEPDTGKQAQSGTLIRHYEFSWGSWPNIQSLSMNYLGIAGLLNDGIWHGIQGSHVNEMTKRFLNLFLNFFMVQGGFSCYFMGTLEHELGHVGYAFAAGYKPHLASYDTETIRPEYLARTTGDRIIMYLGGGMNTDTYTAYQAITALYSGAGVPQCYSLIIMYKKISNFQYVYRNDNYVRYPSGNIKEFYKNYDPLIYDIYLTMKYGYYDSVLPVWAYAPYYNKSLFVPANPYAYINPFLKDQYRRMKTAYLIELLDPTFIELFWGIRSLMKYGDPVFAPLMIPVKTAKFMPGMRASLGTYGVENYYDLHFVIQDLFQFSVYYRNGGNKWDTVHGCGAEVRNVTIVDGLSMTYQVDYWTIVRGNTVAKNRDYLVYNNLQPAAGLRFFRKFPPDTLGINVFMKINWEFYQDWYLTGGIGYKTYGGLVGRQLEAGVYGYGGVGFNIRYGT